MRRASELIGKPIIVSHTGERCATIRDLVVDRQSSRLLGFVCGPGDGSQGTLILPWKDVQRLAAAAVFVLSRNALVPPSQAPQIRHILRRQSVISGAQVLTAAGRSLGTLTDILFREKDGHVEGLLVSGGFSGAYLGRDQAAIALEMQELADVWTEEVSAPEGRQVELRQAATEERDIVVSLEDVDVEYHKLFGEDRVAHWDIAAPDGTLLARQGESVTEELAEQAARYGMLDELFWAVGGREIEEPALPGEVTLEDARGLTAQWTVRASRGLQIIAEGQIVTQQVIGRAVRYRKEQALLEAVGLLRAQGLQAGSGDTIAQVLHRAWGRVGGLFSGLRRSIVERAQAFKIGRMVGRPVGCAVYDYDERLILDHGEPITAEAIAQARRSGVLDRLLAAVEPPGSPARNGALHNHGLDDPDAVEEIAHQRLSERG